jgi:hypothetical protein
MKSSEKSTPAPNEAPLAPATVYRLKVQAIRSRQQQPRLSVYFPLPLAAAIGLRAGESVQWELLDRGELHLVREQSPPPRARGRARP